MEFIDFEIRSLRRYKMPLCKTLLPYLRFNYFSCSPPEDMLTEFADEQFMYVIKYNFTLSNK